MSDPRILPPADPMESQRFYARLKLAGTDLAAIARRTGDPNAIDANDLEGGVQLGFGKSKEDDIDKRLRADIGAVETATAMLSKPTVGPAELVRTVRALRSSVDDAAKNGDLIGSSRSVFVAYRSSLERFQSALSSSHLSVELPVETAATNASDLIKAAQSVSRQRGQDAVPPRLTLSDEVGGRDHHFLWTDWVLWHTDGTRRLTLNP